MFSLLKCNLICVQSDATQDFLSFLLVWWSCFAVPPQANFMNGLLLPSSVVLRDFDAENLKFL